MMFVIEILYFITFLTVVGLVIWWQIVENYSTQFQRRYIQLSNRTMIVLILCLTYYIVETMYEKGLGLDNLPIQYFILLCVVVIGFPFLYKKYWFDTVWVFLLVICQQIKQDVFQSYFSFINFIFNSIHVIAASIWFAGLTIIIMFWNKFKRDIQSFYPIYSEYTFFCLTILMFTAGLSASLYYTKLHYFFSVLGLLFLLKIMIGSIVAFVIYKIRAHRIERSCQWSVISNYVLFLFIILIIVVEKYVR